MLNRKEQDSKAQVAKHHHFVVELKSQWLKVVLQGLSLCLHSNVFIGVLVRYLGQLVFHAKKLLFELPEWRNQV